MNRICLLLFAAGFCFHLQAQSRTIYYNQNWEIVPQEEASYYRKCEIGYGPNRLFFTQDFQDFSIDGTLLTKGAYSTIGAKHGEFVFYYPSGKIQAQGKFNNGLRRGLWKYFFPNGDLEREVMFHIPENFISPTDDFTPITVYDSTGKLLIEKKTGRWHYEYKWFGVSGRFIVEGEFKNGKKEGVWECKLSNGQLLYREVYKNNKFQGGIKINEEKQESLVEPFNNKFMLPYKFEVTETFVYTQGVTRDLYPFLSFLPGKTDPSQAESNSTNDTSDDEKIFLAVEQPAEFPGGMATLHRFIIKNLKYPVNARRMGIEGSVFVKFIVQKDGSISNIEIVKGINADLDKEAIRVVGLFPKWNPGMQNGKAVKCQFVLPIPFKLNR